MNPHTFQLIVLSLLLAILFRVTPEDETALRSVTVLLSLVLMIAAISVFLFS